MVIIYNCAAVDSPACAHMTEHVQIVSCYSVTNDNHAAQILPTLCCFNVHVSVCGCNDVEGWVMEVCWCQLTARATQRTWGKNSTAIVLSSETRHAFLRKKTIQLLSGTITSSPLLDNIRVMVIAWRLRGNITMGCVTQCSQLAVHLHEQVLQVQQIGFVRLGPLCHA